MNKILFKLIEGNGKFFLNGDLKNGEIVNPEVLPTVKVDNIRWYLNGSKSMEIYLKDGDTFDLPEGMGFEEQRQMALSSNPDSNYVDCNEDQLRDGFNSRKVIRLLPEKPVQKEESQPGLGVYKIDLSQEVIEKIKQAKTLDIADKQFIEMNQSYKMLTEWGNIQFNKGFNEALEEVKAIINRASLCGELKEVFEEIAKIKK